MENGKMRDALGGLLGDPRLWACSLGEGASCGVLAAAGTQGIFQGPIQRGPGAVPWGSDESSGALVSEMLDSL